MSELLLEHTALPNLHPALVHLPLAAPFLALLADAGLLLARRASPALERASAALWAVALLGAAAAWAAGREAASGLGPLAPQADAALGRHADAAQWALGALAAAALVRGVAAWRPGAAAARAAALALGVLACALLLRTGDLGGALVFEHGVAVAAPPTPDPRPAAPTPHTAPAATGALPAAPPPVRLEVAGEARWRLGPEFADGAVEARLDASGLSGRAGVGLRVAPGGDGVLLALDSDGRFALLERRNGRDLVLHEGRVEPRRGAFRLSLSAAGRHWKGFLDGEPLAHAHRDLPRPGAAVVWVEGSGSLSVLGAQATPQREGGAAAPGGNAESFH